MSPAPHGPELSRVKLYGLYRGGTRKADVLVLTSGKTIVSWPTSTIVYDSEEAARAVHIDHMGGRGEVTEFRREGLAQGARCTRCGWRGYELDAMDPGTGALYCPGCTSAATVVYDPPLSVSPAADADKAGAR